MHFSKRQLILFVLIAIVLLIVMFFTNNIVKKPKISITPEPVKTRGKNTASKQIIFGDKKQGFSEKEITGISIDLSKMAQNISQTHKECTVIYPVKPEIYRNFINCMQENSQKLVGNASEKYYSDLGIMLRKNGKFFLVEQTLECDMVSDPILSCWLPEKLETAADIGSGPGVDLLYFLNTFSKLCIVEADKNSITFLCSLVDIYSKRFPKRKYSDRLIIIRNPLENVCLPANSFDLITNFNIHLWVTDKPFSIKSESEFLKGKKLFYDSVIMALKPGGRLIIKDMHKDSVPNFAYTARQVKKHMNDLYVKKRKLIFIGEKMKGRNSNYFLLCYEKSGASVSTSNWFKFRGNLRNTGSAGFSEGISSPVLLWKFKARHEVMSSPAFDKNGKVYAGSHDGNVYAVSSDGKGKSVLKAGESVISSPLVLNNLITIGSMDGFIYCFDSDGKISFKSDFKDWICSSPSVTEDGSFIAAGRNGKLACFSPDGRIKWSADIGENDYEVQSSPAVFGDRIYIGSGNGNVYGFDDKGSLLWKYKTEGAVAASPVVDRRGYIYIGSRDGVFYCLNPDGSLKWQYKTGLKITSSAGLTFDHKLVFGCTDGYVYCLDTEGKLQWKYKTGKSIESSPAIDSKNRIYIGSDDCHIYALDQNGNLLWKFRTGAPVLSSPALGKDGTLVFGCEDKYIYCLGEKKLN
jgi:outer membrane protein assembly factor BamB